MEFTFFFFLAPKQTLSFNLIFCINFYLKGKRTGISRQICHVLVHFPSVYNQFGAGPSLNQEPRPGRRSLTTMPKACLHVPTVSYVPGFPPLVRGSIPWSGIPISKGKQWSENPRMFKDQRGWLATLPCGPSARPKSESQLWL